MSFSVTSKKSFKKNIKKKVQNYLASKPSAFKRWLQVNSENYIYAIVNKPQKIITEQGYRINRLRLQLFVSKKAPDDLVRRAIRRNSSFLFDRKPNLILTDFKLDNGSDSVEVELKHQEDFFLDCYYASKYATIFENNLQDMQFVPKVKTQNEILNVKQGYQQVN